jgi:Fe2+ or Zn2+ uptake regulation protein
MDGRVVIKTMTGGNEMRSYRYSVKSAREVHKVVCNCCGKEIERNQFGYLEEHVSLEKEWGYGSEFDGETHSIDLCQSCYKKLTSNFKIQPLSVDKNYINFLPV